MFLLHTSIRNLAKVIHNLQVRIKIPKLIFLIFHKALEIHSEFKTSCSEEEAQISATLSRVGGKIDYFTNRGSRAF